MSDFGSTEKLQKCKRFTGTPPKKKQHFSGKGIRQSVRRLFRETVRKQEHPCVGEYSSKPLISHWDKSVCFTFSRATEDIANTEMLHKERRERTSSLINFSIKLLRSHIWLLKRGAQLGPRCVCVCVVMLMRSDGDFLLKQLHWDADRDTKRKTKTILDK